MPNTYTPSGINYVGQLITPFASPTPDPGILTYALASALLGPVTAYNPITGQAFNYPNGIYLALTAWEPTSGAPTINAVDVQAFDPSDGSTLFQLNIDGATAGVLFSNGSTPIDDTHGPTFSGISLFPGARAGYFAWISNGVTCLILAVINQQGFAGYVSELADKLVTDISPLSKTGLVFVLISYHTDSMHNQITLFQVNVPTSLPSAPIVLEASGSTPGAYEWISTGSGTDEYACVLATSHTNPNLNEPSQVTFDGVPAAQGTVGSLAQGQWGWGASGTGFNTVVVRLPNIVLNYNSLTAVPPGIFGWQPSAHGTGEYYLLTDLGGNPNVVPPPYVSVVCGDNINPLVTMSAGTVGSLTNHQYAYAQNDGQGFSTLYVRFDSSTPQVTVITALIADPDSAGVAIVANYASITTTEIWGHQYVQADYSGWTSDPGTTVIDVQQLPPGWGVSGLPSNAVALFGTWSSNPVTKSVSSPRLATFSVWGGGTAARGDILLSMPSPGPGIAHGMVCSPAGYVYVAGTNGMLADNSHLIEKYAAWDYSAPVASVTYGSNGLGTGAGSPGDSLVHTPQWVGNNLLVIDENPTNATLFRYDADLNFISKTVLSATSSTASRYRGGKYANSFWGRFY